MPPSWARKQDPLSHAKSLSYEDEEVTCQTWRRKFLWFPAELGDDGLGYPQPHWPPYWRPPPRPPLPLLRPPDQLPM